ncbi:MAG TPA: molybdenum cofactor guanylyltransferase [Candidatus Binataceae bacterium]|nr:molybdenum cofactor guanylyltransferase [Candidatus Binataceae bacterium]
MSEHGAPVRSAIALAGGRSSRMGRAKATLPRGGLTLLEHIVAELGRYFGDLVIVAAPESVQAALAVPAAARIIRDDRAYEGPVDALARGLDAARADAAFACSCDLPMLDARVAAALLAMLSGYDAVIPSVGGRLQPLHAVYRREVAGALRAMRARGENRLSEIAGEVRTRIVDEAELRALDPELRSFMNVNTPADYARAIRLIR